MLCAAACPVDAIEASGFDFGAVVAELSRAERPVLGCMHKEGLRSHAKTPCLGFLAEEHLVFLLSFLGGTVQLNLTECGECENRLITERLFDVVASVKRTVPGIAPRLRAITDKDDLEFQEISLSRRGFFRLLKGSAVEGVSGAVGQIYQREKSQSYGSKKIPGKRELLNISYRRSGSGAEGLRALYFDIEVAGVCNACGACVAICPNGAFTSTRGGEAKTLSFNAARCSGCGLCEEFCVHDALKLKGGHVGSGLMEFLTVRSVMSKRAQQGNAA
jgi:formate hydrogenlyase subunit 6/NADH:ubiquinone oxidoreductase subunit I